MMTLFTAMLIGIVLAGYLTLVRHQEVAVTRSQGWNAALTMAEAGVEEALAQLNSGAASFSSDLSANGWGPPAGGSFNLQSRALTGGRYDVRYFTNSLSPTPTIYSTGYVTLPAMSATVARQVKVSTKTVPLINVAVAARYGITMSSGSLSADSYNSADAAHSDNGQYPSTFSKRLNNGDVASMYGPVSFGGPNIQGDLFLGPSATGAGGVTVSGTIYHDYNVEYPDVAAPPNAASWAPAGVTLGKHDFGPGFGGDWWVNDSLPIVVRAGVRVRLYVATPNFNPSSIQIEGLNAFAGSLVIYQASGSASFVGTEPVHVDSHRADCFSYYGLAGVTSVTYTGNYNDFFGVIYAPSANVMLNDGFGDMDFVGACIARSITINGSYKFHYDENLQQSGPIRGFFAKAWEEQKQ